MKNHDEVLSLGRQTQNLLETINPSDYENFDWTAIIKDGLNILSHERPNCQSIGQVIGVVADLNPETALTVNSLYAIFSPGRPDKMPPLAMLPQLMVACKSDAPLRFMAAAFGLRLVKDEEKMEVRADEVVQ